jgi:mRNA interferase RelE/StbE
MAAFHIRILDEAIDDLARLDKPVGRRVVDRINWLGANFDSLKPFPLAGDLAGLYKLRAGDYRILYEILHRERTIVIHKIGHRREIYKRR